MNDFPPHLLFYDGVCAMCNWIVEAMVRMDHEGRFHFAPLQGPTAERARALHPEFPEEIETVVYLRRGEVFLRSRAAALAAAELPYPAKALSWLRFVPQRLVRQVRSMPSSARGCSRALSAIGDRLHEDVSKCHTRLGSPGRVASLRV